MVTPLRISHFSGSRNGRLPTVVELVGPAGAGKTTVAKALSRHGDGVVAAIPPYFRNPRDMPFFAGNGVRLLPTLLRSYSVHGDWPSRREIAWMAILEGWHATLTRRMDGDARFIVLDQGPIFLIAQMCEFGSGNLARPATDRWWCRIHARWADVLGLVVWLDTADRILVRRITERSTWHLVKELPEAEAISQLARWRTAYRCVLAKLMANAQGPKMVHIDTGLASPEEVVARILREFDRL